MSTEEQILVVPARVFHGLGHFQGFSSDPDKYLSVLLSPEHVSFRPRSEMEQDPHYKQLIPYVVLRCGDQLFQYTRGKGQGEKRLHALKSVGIGGHISTLDAGGSSTPYEAGMRRELEEELEIDIPFEPKCVGLINDDYTEVGRVHLGVVHLVELPTPAVRPREDDLVDAGFQPLRQIIETLGEYETWSQICVQAMFIHHKW